MDRRISEVITVFAAAFLFSAQPASAQGASGGQKEPPAQGGAGMGGGMQGGPGMGGGMQGGTGSSAETGTSGGAQGGAMQGGGMGGTGMQGKGSRQGMSSQRHVRGKVASVDASQNEITLDNGQKLQLTGEAKVLEGRKQSSLDAVKPGDRVRASLDAQGQVQRVVVIHEGSRAATSPMRQRQRIHTPGTGRTPAQTPPATPEPGTSGETAPSTPQR